MIVEEPSIRLMNHVIDRVVPMWKMVQAAGIEDFPHGEATCYCPFHDNTDTKAAKVYREPTGDRLWCYAEHKMYFPHDVPRLHMIPQTVEQLFKRIWGQLSDEQQQMLISELDEPVDTMPSNWEEIKEGLELYRSGRSSYKEALNLMLQLKR